MASCPVMSYHFTCSARYSTTGSNSFRASTPPREQQFKKQSRWRECVKSCYEGREEILAVADTNVPRFTRRWSRMQVQRISWRDLAASLGPVLLTSAVALWVAFHFVRPAPPSGSHHWSRPPSPLGPLHEKLSAFVCCSAMYR